MTKPPKDQPPPPPCPTELTETGEQYIIPGTERKLDKPDTQLDLW